MALFYGAMRELGGQCMSYRTHRPLHSPSLMQPVALPLEQGYLNVHVAAMEPVRRLCFSGATKVEADPRLGQPSF